MAAPRPFPVYPKNPHAASGQARIKIKGRHYYLGRHGSPESYAEYERLRLAHASGAISPAIPEARGLTIGELIAAWLADEPRGPSHAEVSRIARACEPMSRLFGATPANEFRALRLKAVQEAMITQRWMTAEEKANCGRWSCGYINKSVERIVRVFKWGESNERLPMGTTEHLRTVPDLTVNDPRVIHCEDVEPADWKTQVEPCLPFLSPVVKAIVFVQYHGGLRPNEALTMRRCEVDQTSVDGVWLYRPQSHKGTWRKHELVKVLGPISQRHLAPWLMAAEPDGFIFPPALRQRGALHYTQSGYRQAIARAARKAKVEHWFPYQLRHAMGHAAEEAAGLAGAAAMLGHKSLETTRRYTDSQRIELAAKTARKIG